MKRTDLDKAANDDQAGDVDLSPDMYCEHRRTRAHCEICQALARTVAAVAYVTTPDDATAPVKPAAAKP